MNISRGLFRLWLVATALWLALAATIAWDDVTSATRGRYQYAHEMKEDVKPWEQFDNKKSVSKIFKKPSEAKWPASFDKVEYQHQKGFDESVTEKTLELVDFPDGSSLYLYTAFGKPEQDLVGRWFWEKRWERRFSALRNEGGIALFGIIPPLLLLALWFVGKWVFAEFRPTPQ